ncbi:hypothetical protein NDU88_001524 [Pleurodeles waltl]|uniref:Uncharacterized protein n=1 Tax=Pleurodeles waltl TaxID=8319 RepID=A0AAV7NKE7_PLEWA|nr:hypothetical protein NDU88_001524 [Pleurodeles waltl]
MYNCSLSPNVKKRVTKRELLVTTGHPLFYVKRSRPLVYRSIDLHVIDPLSHSQLISASAMLNGRCKNEGLVPLSES